MSHEKLTNSVCQAIATLVEANHSLSAAAQECGVSKASASQWYYKGKEANSGSKYRRFYEAINEARDKAEQALLNRVQSIAENGCEVQKERVVKHPDGTQTIINETQTTQEFAVIRWLLEKRHGWDQTATQAMEKTINRVLTVSRNQLPEEHWFRLINAIAHDPVLGDVDFDKDLLLTE